ncbi:MAG: ABC transporter ATP-binding protein [Promethearchaeota archaeon]
MKKKKKNNASEDKDKEKDDYSMFFILKFLLSYVGRKNRRIIIPLAIFISLNILVSLATPWVFKNLIDDGLGGGIGVKEGDIDVVIYLGTLFFFLTIVGVLIKIMQGYLINKIAHITMYNLRHELFIKFQHLGLDYHEGQDKSAGKKINYLTGDVNTIQELLNSGLLMVIGNIFLVAGALGFMIYLSPQLTLVEFILAPILFIIAGSVMKKSRKYFKELREKISVVTSTLDESITGMRVIQSFAVEEENFQEFNSATEEERKTTLKAAKLLAFVPAVLIFTITIGIALMLFTAGLLIREGLITQGTIVAFIFYMFMFFEPLISLISFFTLLQNSIAAGNRIVKLMSEDPSIQSKPNAIKLEKVRGEISYEDVYFSYNPEIVILRNINIGIKAKERLALVGYTGAGKSTFIKLLSRFYDPTKGVVRLDGIDLRDLEVKSIRESMGIVLQENFLFSGSVMDNIRYGRLDASDEEVIEVAKKVSAHDMIIELENGYNTDVGERGSKLSEGQRQLICFARALLADPPILILDEATSAIDPYSELLIQQALETLLKDRTSISIAHRLSTIINSDRIVVLDKGQIIEQGSHDELVKKGSFYKHLYEMQFKDPFKKDNS